MDTGDYRTDIYLFADDAKICRYITCTDDYQILQETVDKIQHWSDVRLLKLNVDKCKVVSYGRQVEKNKYVMVQNKCIVELQRDAYVKDLGVVFGEKLNFSQHISERINKAYSMLWLIRRNFRDIGPVAFILIYKHLVRSHLEYNNSVWAPYRKSDIDNLEKVQKRATKIIQGMGNFKYPERLRQLDLPTLAYRRNRRDMI